MQGPVCAKCESWFRCITILAALFAATVERCVHQCCSKPHRAGDRYHPVAQHLPWTLSCHRPPCSKRIAQAAGTIRELSARLAAYRKDVASASSPDLQVRSQSAHLPFVRPLLKFAA